MILMIGVITYRLFNPIATIIMIPPLVYAIYFYYKFNFKTTWKQLPFEELVKMAENEEEEPEEELGSRIAKVPLRQRITLRPTYQQPEITGESLQELYANDKENLEAAEEAR